MYTLCTIVVCNTMCNLMHVIATVLVVTLSAALAIDGKVENKKHYIRRCKKRSIYYNASTKRYPKIMNI